MAATVRMRYARRVKSDPARAIDRTKRSPGMSKDLRRKQKKAKAAAEAARRKAKAAAKAMLPKFDPSLPTTVAEIEAAMEALTDAVATEPGGRVEHSESGKRIFLTPSQAKLMKLQLQLFRVVFGREPSQKDPLFWDRAREREGVFKIDPEKDSRTLSKALAGTSIRPEIAYAMALTGIILTPQNEHLFSEEDLEEWEAAIGDYVEQAKTGVVPLTPGEFLQAWEVVNQTASQDNVIPIRLAGHPNSTENRMLVTLQEQLGSDVKAIAAMSRIAALVVLVEMEEFKDLVAPEGFNELAVVAAASVKIDLKTRLFDTESFRRKFETLSEEEE